MRASNNARRWMYRMIIIFITSTCWGHPDWESDATNIFSLRSSITHGILNEPCIALIRETIAKTDRVDLQCATPRGFIYNVPLVDSNWIRAKEAQGELKSGHTILEIPRNTTIDVATQTIMIESIPKLLNNHARDRLGRNRRLTTKEKAVGQKSVLVVRVQATDSTTSISEDQLASDIFGDSGDQVNLRSQYLACSFGKFELIKAPDRNGVTTNIRNGVVTIGPNVDSSVGDARMLNSISLQLLDEFLTDIENLADFIMFCLPPGAMHPDDIAYAWMDDFRSVYNDMACTYVSAQVHEVGHNLNLAHSSLGTEEYGDRSGMMGYSYEYDEVPYMCFNAAKSWQLGWYDDKTTVIAPLSNHQYVYNGRLAGIVDYQETDASVLIKIEQTLSPNAFFINYNKGTGVNKHTQLGKNQVLMTMKHTVEEGNMSDLIAQLNVGDAVELQNFNGQMNETLAVRFVSTIDGVAEITIELDGPNVQMPSDSPTAMPSMLPSVSPSPSTSARPSVVQQPSSSPTGTLSLEPSVQPSTTPSQWPSLPPSNFPSVLPSAMPSTLPSTMPSLSSKPSAVPSQAPSSSMIPSSPPSDVPSVFPSVFPSQFPSLQPSNHPSFRSVELESSLTIEVYSLAGDGENFAETLCVGAQVFFDSVLKRAYGDATETTIECTSEERRRLGDGTLMISAIAKTYFPMEAIAPLLNEYESYIKEVLLSDETENILPKIIRGTVKDFAQEDEEVRTEVDSSLFPPVLKVMFGTQASVSYTVFSQFFLLPIVFSFFAMQHVWMA